MIRIACYQHRDQRPGYTRGSPRLVATCFSAGVSGYFTRTSVSSGNGFSVIAVSQALQRIVKPAPPDDPDDDRDHDPDVVAQAERNGYGHAVFLGRSTRFSMNASRSRTRILIRAPTGTPGIPQLSRLAHNRL